MITLYVVYLLECPESCCRRVDDVHEHIYAETETTVHTSGRFWFMRQNT